MQISITFKKVNGKTLFVINEKNGDVIGTITEAFVPRPMSSYYDAHRHAKGDAEIAVTSTEFLSTETECRFVKAFSFENLAGETVLDFPKIKRHAKGQPTLIKGKIVMAAGMDAEI